MLSVSTQHSSLFPYGLPSLHVEKTSTVKGFPAALFLSLACDQQLANIQMGQHSRIIDSITTEAPEAVVFVAILPYSQYIYAECMTSTKEPQWISVNNNALEYFEGVPLMVVFDSCKLAVIANNARNKNAYVIGSDPHVQNQSYQI